MDKITIVAGDTQKYENLIEYLKFVFPECEIQLITERNVSYMDYSQDSQYDYVTSLNH